VLASVLPNRRPTVGDGQISDRLVDGQLVDESEAGAYPLEHEDLCDIDATDGMA
jgi:hypothetical protein